MCVCVCMCVVYIEQRLNLICIVMRRRRVAVPKTQPLRACCCSLPRIPNPFLSSPLPLRLLSPLFPTLRLFIACRGSATEAEHGYWPWPWPWFWRPVLVCGVESQLFKVQHLHTHTHSEGTRERESEVRRQTHT